MAQLLAPGARAPLLERLSLSASGVGAATPVERPGSSTPGERPGPGSGAAAGLLDAAQLEQSILRELDHLFNTRVGLSARACEQAERSVVNYGIPDLSELYTESGEDHRQIERLIERTLQVFEPRLLQPRVEIGKQADGQHPWVLERGGMQQRIAPRGPQALLVKISGNTQLGRLMTPVSFVMPLPERE